MEEWGQGQDTIAPGKSLGDGWGLVKGTNWEGRVFAFTTPPPSFSFLNYHVFSISIWILWHHASIIILQSSSLGVESRLKSLTSRERQSKRNLYTESTTVKQKIFSTSFVSVPKQRVLKISLVSCLYKRLVGSFPCMHIIILANHWLRSFANKFSPLLIG